MTKSPQNKPNLPNLWTEYGTSIATCYMTKCRARWACFTSGRAWRKWRGRGPCGDRSRRATSAGRCGPSLWSHLPAWTPTRPLPAAWSHTALEQGTEKRRLGKHKWWYLFLYLRLGLTQEKSRDENIDNYYEIK